MERPLCRLSIFRRRFPTFRRFAFPGRRGANTLFDAEGILQALFDERDRKVRDVYPDPRAAQRLCGGNCGPAAAEGVKNNVAGIAARGSA